jgi:hypothetical protein
VGPNGVLWYEIIFLYIINIRLWFI